MSSAVPASRPTAALAGSWADRRQPPWPPFVPTTAFVFPRSQSAAGSAVEVLKTDKATPVLPQHPRLAQLHPSPYIKVLPALWTTDRPKSRHDPPRPLDPHKKVPLALCGRQTTQILAPPQPPLGSQISRSAGPVLWKQRQTQALPCGDPLGVSLGSQQ